MPPRLTAIMGTALLAAGAGLAVWHFSPGRPDRATAPARVMALPVPPFPPRIATGTMYEHCLAVLAADPNSAELIAEAWASDGGGDGAAHCQGLAMIALGQPAQGAERLERLASTSLAPDPARATVFAQAAQARMMAGQAGRAQDDATSALALRPADIELLIQRAAAAAAQEQWGAAIADLTAALRSDGRRPDALVPRAVAWRKLGRLDLARADADEAIALDPANAEALLERGIERQRLGDAAGARADWQRIRGLDPNSTAADLAEQNLALLDAGPNQR